MQLGRIVTLLALAACTRTLNVAVQVVSPCNQPDVLSGDEFLRVRVEGASLDTPRVSEFNVSAHHGAVMNIPVTESAVISVLGYASDLSLPADIAGGLGSLDLSGASSTSAAARVQVGHVSTFMGTTSDTVCTGLTQPRQGHSATLLPNGTVFIAGGEQLTNNVSTLVRTTEIYQPASGAFTMGPDLPEGRAYHTATPLAAGRVLLCGGEGLENGRAASLRTCQIYDADSKTFLANPPSMAIGRMDHTATLLADGRVVITGGRGIPTDYYQQTEVYDTATHVFTSAPDMLTARAQHTATLLSDGVHILIVGGLEGTTVKNDVELWSVTATHAAGTLSQSRYAHAAALLGDGRVIIGGGMIDAPAGSNPTVTASVEVYDGEQTGLVCPSGLSLSEARGRLAAVSLPKSSGGVLFVGGTGINGAISAAGDVVSVGNNRSCQEIAIHASAGTLAHPRTRAQAAVLTGGEVLIVGGSSSAGPTASPVVEGELFVSPR